MLEKATAKFLKPKISRFSSGSDRGFYLLCKYCTDRHQISVNRKQLRDDSGLNEAANKFADAGWRVDNGIPVCPGCCKRKKLG
jgi:hypothetical protein